MRVLMFGWEFPPAISGGLGTACFGITRGLTELGQEVIFVLPRIKDKINHARMKFLAAEEYPFSEWREATSFGAVWENLKVRIVDSALRSYMNEKQYQSLLTKGDHKGTSHFAMSGTYGPNLLAEIWRYGKVAEGIAQQEKFDIIHGHDWTSVLACVRAQKISGKPYVYHAHALEFDRSGENINQIVYDMEKYGMETADHVIAVSHYTKENIIRRYGLSPEKITVVHNAVSRGESEVLARTNKKDAEKLVLFLGRITFQKGPDYFVEAASLVLQSMAGVHFVMAGAGDMMPQMIEKVAGLHMGSHFHFTGFLQGQDVERIFAMSDLYVMPSVSEPFGISPLEAMLYDVPVIISRQSGVAEILHHALKVDFWNVRELADKMIALLRHPSLGDEMSARAREELKNIKWEQAAEKIIAVYRQALND
ncbi:MAG: glycosyltransferase family 4 protein [Deltaproteobacteria bacterium]|nr:glycosyltransferase family 4 protein [Deltaproteobacteria bacterium]